MSWHIIVRVGEEDRHAPALSPDEPRLEVGFARPADPARMREQVMSQIVQALGAPPGAAAVDLLQLSMAVYAADLRVCRSWAEDRWTRDFVLHLPVSDPGRWRPTSSVIADMLSFLSGDRWRLVLRERDPGDHADRQAAHPDGAVSLFSGGLDSLVGALDMAAQGQQLLLVGHYGPGVTLRFQEQIAEPLIADHPVGQLTRCSFFVQPPTKRGIRAENTQRSRSLLFLGLGVAVADACGPQVPLYVPENGLISLNVPLHPARAGSLSTRTTHPHFLALFRSVMGAVGLFHPVEARYAFKTKGKMLKDCANPGLLRHLAPRSMSCAHPEAMRFRGHALGDHCGYCVPCLVRRAAMVAADLPDRRYVVDPRTDAGPASQASGRDAQAMQVALARYRGMSPIQRRLAVLAAGPLPADDVAEYAAVYDRGMAELRCFFRQGE